MQQIQSLIQQVRSLFHALISIAYILWLKWSTWCILHRRLLMGAMLIMMIVVILLTSLPHPRLAGPGCGAGCILPL